MDKSWAESFRAEVDVAVTTFTRQKENCYIKIELKDDTWCELRFSFGKMYDVALEIDRDEYQERVFNHSYGLLSAEELDYICKRLSHGIKDEFDTDFKYLLLNNVPMYSAPIPGKADCYFTFHVITPLLVAEQKLLRH